MSASALMMAASAVAADSDAPLIERPDYQNPSGIFTIETLEQLGRVSEPTVSPDGRKVLFGITWESIEQNKGNRELWVMNLDGSEQTRITTTAKSENSAVWIDGGKRIAFLYPDADGKPQVWVMNPDGSERKQISTLKGGVSGFLFSPDQANVVMIGTVPVENKDPEIFDGIPQATGRVITDVMYKHWDEWVVDIPHPFIAPFDGNTIGQAIDIMEGEPFEAPMKPFGGIESFAWSKDGTTLVYVSRKKTGLEYAESTNSDLYAYNLNTGQTINLTEGMMGYDTCPSFSPDGNTLAWLSMEHDGCESDKNRLFIMDMNTGERTDLTVDWDYTIEQFLWNPNGKSIWFNAYHQGGAPIFSIDVKTRKVTTWADGICDFTSLSCADEKTVITMRHSMLRPNEIVKVVAKGRDKFEVTDLTDINGFIFSQLTMPTVEKRMVPTTDGKEMLTWVVLPPNFDANKKYPAILYCQGGPQSAVSQFWSYRWNFALMASRGYVIIAPNRRGVPGFGTEWEAQISKDYPGQNMADYLAAVDCLKQEPYIDEDHIGATGASYGGFSIYYLAGNHDGRFKAFWAHAGIFNIEAQYLETEEMWFANWDMGGAYWDRNNAVAPRPYANSPHRFVDRWDTPIAISHGEFDFRILASQGMAAFNAARMRGIPCEMVLYPDENHWILKPQNAIEWQRLFFRWFDRWLK